MDQYGHHIRRDFFYWLVLGKISKNILEEDGKQKQKKFFFQHTFCGLGNFRGDPLIGGKNKKKIVFQKQLRFYKHKKHEDAWMLPRHHPSRLSLVLTMTKTASGFA